MSYISNKALIIAVSLMITMAIASSVLYILNQTKQVYKTVYETDTSIQSRFDEFDTYDGAKKTGVDLINVVKKYIDSNFVYVFAMSIDIEKIDVENEKSTRLNKEGWKESLTSDIYEKKYTTYVKRLDDGKIVINFKPNE